MPDVLLIGAGAWGRNVARNLAALGRLRTVVDADPRALEAMRAAHPELRCGTDPHAMLADPGVRAVYVATPAETHTELARAALEAGKDVLVEKPLCLDVSEGRRLVELARARERVLMVGHLLLFHPAIERLKQLIDEGALGPLRYVYSNRLNFGRMRTRENALWSFAPHDVSVIDHLLGERPTTVRAMGDAWLTRDVQDVTVSHLGYPSGITAHIFVSWLHPFKEQKLVVVGERQMAVFSDTDPHPLVLYPHAVDWIDRMPVARRADAEPVALEAAEPLRRECEHFLACVDERRRPRTDGQSGLEVLEVLAAADASVRRGGAAVPVAAPPEPAFQAHESAVVDEGASVGAGTRIWHFAHVMAGAEVGAGCVLGQNVHVARGARIGDRVKIQNNVSVYAGVTVEDEVFLGPSCVFTNVSNPRAPIDRHALFETTLVRRGATIGANATIVCGVTVGRHAFVGAGAVVTEDVPDHALVVGVPARLVGWVGRHGVPLEAGDDGLLRCPESGLVYERSTTPEGTATLRCLDLGDEEELPEELRVGQRSYRELRPRGPGRGRA